MAHLRHEQRRSHPRDYPYNVIYKQEAPNGVYTFPSDGPLYTFTWCYSSFLSSNTLAIRAVGAPTSILGSASRFLFCDHKCLAAWAQQEALTYEKLVKEKTGMFKSDPDGARARAREFATLHSWMATRAG